MNSPPCKISSVMKFALSPLRRIFCLNCYRHKVEWTMANYSTKQEFLHNEDHSIESPYGSSLTNIRFGGDIIRNCLGSKGGRGYLSELTLTVPGVTCRDIFSASSPSIFTFFISCSFSSFSVNSSLLLSQSSKSSFVLGEQNTSQVGNPRCSRRRG